MSTMHGLTAALENQNELREAEETLRLTLDSQIKVLGPEHPDTLASMIYLAAVVVKVNNYGEAEEFLQQTLELWAKLFCPEHPVVLRSIPDLAAILTEQKGKLEDAESLHSSTVERSLRSHRNLDPATLRCVNILAEVFQKQEHWDEAHTLLEEILYDSLKGSHPLSSMERLVKYYQEQERSTDAKKLHAQAKSMMSRMTCEPEYEDDAIRSLPSLTDGSILISAQGDELEAAQEFALWLLHDATLKTLFTVAVEKIGTQRFSKNAVKLVKSFATNLKQEAKGDLQQACVRLLRSRARYIVSCCSQSLDPHQNNSVTQQRMDGLSDLPN